MEKKGTWKRVKSTIHRWYVAFLRSLGLRKEEPYENRHTDTPPDSPGVPPVPMPDIPPLSPEGSRKQHFCRHHLQTAGTFEQKTALFRTEERQPCGMEGTSGKFCGRLSFPAQHTSCRSVAVDNPAYRGQDRNQCLVSRRRKN